MFQIQEVSHVNPLENYVHITNESFSCKIYPNLGASIQELVCKNVSLIKGFDFVDDYKTKHTSSILCPFPGRIEHGTYTYQGKIHHLDTNEQNRDNAIHGKVAHEFFELIDSHSTAEQAKLSFSYTHEPSKGYPFRFELIIVYMITIDSIQLNFQLTNKGITDLPFGLGWHPYFKTPDLANSFLTFNSSKEILCDTEMIPIGEKPIDFSAPMKVEDQHFDTCFTLDDNKIAFQTKEYSIDMEVLQDNVQFIQIFTPAARDCIAIEPMTCSPDVFNNKNGLLELAPKNTYNWMVDFNFKVH